MPSYAIMRFAKMKGGPAKSLEAHHEWKKEQYLSNPDVDKSRSSLNYHIIEPRRSYYYEIQSRIENAGCRVRKDSIKFVDTIVTASPEFFQRRSKEEAIDYFRRAVDFMSEEVGRSNIFSAVVHMDEKTPHMHLCFVPLTQDSRLSAKEIIGNRVKLSAWQDKFHERMSASFPELERGEPAVDTKRKHIPVRLFKQATALTAQMEQIQTMMGNMSAFNLSKRRDAVMNLLLDWFPKAKGFEKQIKQAESGNEELKSEVQRLKQDKENLQGQIMDERRVAYRNGQEYEKLVGEYNDMVDFYNSIPDDLRQELWDMHQRDSEHEQDQEMGWDEMRLM